MQSFYVYWNFYSHILIFMNKIHICVFWSFLTAASSTISSGLKAQTWSPWSPHHQSLYNQTKFNSTTTDKSLSNLNNWTTTQPIRRASMTTQLSRSNDESCVSHSGKKPFKRTNTFDTGLLLLASKNNELKSSTNNSCDTDNSSSSSVERAGSLENVSTRSNPF